MEDKQQTKKKKRFNLDFTNAFIALMGVALVSVVIYAIILNITGVNNTDTSTNQLNGQIQEPKKEVTITGDGYIVYKIGSQYYLEVTDGRKVKDVNALLRSLELPTDTEIINPAAAYPRPVPTEEMPTDTEHEDDNFDPINPNPSTPESDPNE